jgi:hypothetical protein
MSFAWDFLALLQHTTTKKSNTYVTKRKNLVYDYDVPLLTGFNFAVWREV